ncbi:acetyl-CoA carboxylase biotin carboxylase subunit [Tunturibacter empetritectus]|uniref:Acetyl-CoA carboxylase biotin carboxylase subunit n=1 Tax=Tunturiibacter lichenicola TaxID=2051959 RepID=A0A7W8N6E3_9BACT|nr:acetyl-CoA carboxylase biotin carboxylase subunit [Edaphobacter lichenicola]MBB5344945.1 acetyl-CoA carboxylase biotin carboxylase subunit [Edaphobacter lichenicola]
MRRSIKKVLIANRGEIALRVIRACREMGIATVAVYSDADRGALHVLHADEAYRLGPAPAAESYLRGDLILEVARRTGADAVHPGYGFLSENAEFAEACAKAGVTFIGPPASAMRMLGSKTKARQAADAAAMPRVPGSVTGLADVAEALRVAAGIGYPVMLKAAAGGGGKGMRAVTRAEDLGAAFTAASSEAERSFGSGEVYLEKLIERPRHIEIQLMADEHGSCVYLGERECSVQRRHQKVIEEAPSAVVSEDLRRRMGEAAARLALSAGYVNAGTVEFLVDDAENFYFLEMNTRLQVEHPVTEMVTGLDLVHLQLRVAMGEPLPLTQEDVRLRGHAIECRIYAEDPENHFFPSPGLITRLIQPSGPGIREDCAVYEGWNVPLDYDPMLSKLVAFAPTREQAIDRMLRALEEYVIGGIKTNIGLFRRILMDEDFRAARIDTGYLERLLAEPAAPVSEDVPEDVVALAAALFAASARRETVGAPSVSGVSEESRWAVAGRREGLRL